MTEYVAYHDGSKTDEIGFSRVLFRLLAGGYLVGAAAPMQVVQRGAGANMSVDVSIGDALFKDVDRIYTAWLDAAKNVTITAADPTNPRRDIIVGYIDKAVVDPTNANTPGGLKFKAVAGTPAGSPVDPSGATIQASVGAGNPYLSLGRVAVAAAASSIVTANITDLRVPAGLAQPYLVGGNLNTNGHLVPNVADDIVALLAAVQSPTNKTFTGSTNKMTAGGASSVLRDSNAIQIDLEAQRREHEFNYIASGCVWTADAAGSTLAASMSPGVVYINGRRLTAAAVSSRAFAASKDTYVDFQDNGDGTALIVYTPVNNNILSPALALVNSGTFANTLRNAIIITGVSNIAAAASINQGQPDRVLPLVSSAAYSVSDGLGYLIGNRNPNPRVIGYRQIITNKTTTSTSYADIAEFATPVYVPAGRRVRPRFYTGHLFGTAVNTNFVSLNDGLAGGTQLQEGIHVSTVAGANQPSTVEAPLQIPSLSADTTKTYVARFKVNSSTGNIAAAATTPAYLEVVLD